MVQNMIIIFESKNLYLYIYTFYLIISLADFLESTKIGGDIRDSSI